MSKWFSTISLIIFWFVHVEGNGYIFAGKRQYLLDYIKFYVQNILPP